jgi:TolB-like protein/Flp pilus assembly protein TadD
MSRAARWLASVGRFLHQARLRRVPQVVLAYLALAWLLLQVGNVLFDSLGLPGESMRILFAALLIGFPLAVALAWVFDLTPQGLRRDIVDAAIPESDAPHVAAMLVIQPSPAHDQLPAGVRRVLAAFHCRRIEVESPALCAEFGSARQALDAALSLLLEHGNHIRIGGAVGEVARAYGHFAGAAAQDVHAIARLAPAGGLAVTSALRYSALARLHPELSALMIPDGGEHAPGEAHAWIAGPSEIARIEPPVDPGEPESGDAARSSYTGLMVGIAGALVLGLGVALWMRGLEPPLAALHESSIAIMPFTSLSDDPADGYFAQGLADEMHGALTLVEGISLASRRSVYALTDDQIDVRGLGERLNVANVLSASVRREGNRLRVMARLDDTRTGYTRWASSYDREVDDVFAVQRDIAAKVVEAMLGVLPRDPQRISERLAVTANVPAFEHYLRGRQHLERRASETSLADAVASFRSALAEDPGFARAHAGICSAEVRRFERSRDVLALERAELACAQAMASEPGLPVVSLARANLANARGEREEAAELFTLALEDPEIRTDTYLGLADLQLRAGLTDLGLQYLKRAHEADPGYWRVHMALASVHQHNGDLEGAAASFLTAVSLAPDDANAPWNNLGTVRMAQGDYVRAEEAFHQSVRIEPQHSALSNLGTLRYFDRDYHAAAEFYRQAAGTEAADYRNWGNLADALSAANAPDQEVHAAYRQAAERARGWIAARAGDHAARAALAWYLANLGDDREALTLSLEAQAAAGDQPGILYRAALVHARVGHTDAASQWLQQALDAGYPRHWIEASPLLAPLLPPAEG